MDRILMGRLELEHEKARELADASDLLEVQRIDFQHFAVRFHAKTLVRDTDGEIRESTGFDVGFWLDENYLRHVDPLRVVSWLRPKNFFHPNARVPVCCVGHISPGTSLVDLIYRTYELATFQSVMPDERDALNPFACQWARNHPGRFPLDDRPLKRRSRDLQRGAPAFAPSQESR